MPGFRFLVMTMVAAAAVVAAGVAFAVVMIVVIAADIGVECQLTGQQRFHCTVGAAGYTAVELNTGGCQSHLSAAADAAADQNNPKFGMSSFS